MIKFKLKEYIEYYLLLIFYNLLKIIGIRSSSVLGGLMLSIYGIFSKKNKIAFNNIHRVFPELQDNEIKQIIKKMWFHFGRVIGEYPHLKKINIFNNKSIKIVGIDNLLRPLKKNTPCLFFSAHIGNWELTSHPLTKSGFNISFIYRAPNNYFVDKLLRKIREGYGVELIKKGKGGAKDCISILKKNGNIGMLIDQKMNDGIRTKFLGYDAMTASAIAKFALRFKCPIIPSVCFREKGLKFKLKYLPKISYKKIANLKTEEKIMNYLNKYVESWIKEKPEQWIWIHNRW